MSTLRLRRRSSPLVAILVAIALLAGILTYEAWEADHYHRSAALGAIRDYADFAAWEFAVAAKEDLYQTLIAILSPVRHEQPHANGDALPPPSILKREVAKRLSCPDVDAYFFRVDHPHLPSRRVVMAGSAPPASTAQWIRDTIAADLPNYMKDWSYSAVSGTPGGRPGTIVYQLKYDAEMNPAAAYGLQICLSQFAGPSFASALKSHRLLPPSLTKSTPNDSLLSVIVTDGFGHELWRTKHQYPPIHTGSATMPYLGHFTTRVALNPRYADDLLIGGLPQSRLPILIVVLGLTLALAITGVVQLRREDQLARLRGDFIASVSHELRTPLAQLRMFAETLLLGRVRSEDERRRSLEIVDQEARRLSHLVENILQFSRAERHAIKLAPVDTPLAPQISAAIEAFEPIARARQVRVSATLDEALRSVVDPGALRQILLNLLDNAVKYGPPGQEVRVALHASGDRQQARIIVEDSGPGIPADQSQKIWEPFYRLERDANSAVAGSGIGLSVVRELAVRHGGTATVENASSRGGARFIVELPLCARSAQ